MDEIAAVRARNESLRERFAARRQKRTNLIAEASQTKTATKMAATVAAILACKSRASHTTKGSVAAATHTSTPVSKDVFIITSKVAAAEMLQSPEPNPVVSPDQPMIAEEPQNAIPLLHTSTVSKTHAINTTDAENACSCIGDQEVLTNENLAIQQESEYRMSIDLLSEIYFGEGCLTEHETALSSEDVHKLT